MELANYKACICEGSAENAIIDILLDYDLMIFKREEMIEEEVLRCRDGKKFEQKYLRKGFKDKISVIRILDSRHENFKLRTVRLRCRTHFLEGVRTNIKNSRNLRKNPAVFAKKI